MKRIVANVRTLVLFLFLVSLTVLLVQEAKVQAQSQPLGDVIFIAGDVSGTVDIFDPLGNPRRSFNGHFTENDGFAVGDVTGDGKAEILIAGDESGIVDIFDQFGNLSREDGISGNSCFDGIDNGGDGLIDNGDPDCRLRSFDGHFTENDGFAVGDVTGDGFPEILIAGDESHMVDIFFRFGRLSGIEDGIGPDACRDDIDNGGDGLIDNRDPDCYLRSVNGNFTRNDGFAVGDVTGDGVAEILIAGDESGTVDIFDQFGGRPVPSFQSGFGENGGFAVGDVTGDGVAEIWIADVQLGEVFIYHRDPSGDFDPHPLGSFPGDFTENDGFAAFGQFDDRDGDGLPDHWEIFGFDVNEDDIIDDRDVNLPIMGANPDHKDLFLEFDWVPGQAPTQRAIRMLKEAFAMAPIFAGGSLNPDGQPGINLWVDTGGLTDPNGIEDGGGPGTCKDGIDNGGDTLTDAADPDCLVGDKLGGGNAVRVTRVMKGLDDNFYATKKENFTASRKLVFRYGISGNPADNRTIGGKGELGGNDFIDYRHDGGGIMHELGHNLTLRHGGKEDANCKPNYVSVMNYDNTAGINQTGGGTIIDYSPPRFPGVRSPIPIFSPLYALREDHLYEATILDDFDPINRFVFTNPARQKISSPLNGDIDGDGPGDGNGNGIGDGVDWNSDGDTNDADIPVNIDTNSLNPDGTEGIPINCKNTVTNSRLSSNDDWTQISLPFRQFGESSDGPINPVTDPEPTLEESIQLQKALNTTDVSITKTADPDPVAVGTDLVYTLTVINKGPNPASRVQVVDTLPSGVSYKRDTAECAEGPTGKLTCDLGELLLKETRQLRVTVGTAGVCVGGRPTTIINTATVANVPEFPGPDLDTSNDSVTTTTRIVDTTPPDLTLSLSPIVLWPPDHKLVTINASLLASDNCDSNPRIRLVSITSNEPDKGTGAGDTSNDIQGVTFGTDDRTFQLRAERQGTGSGRMYTVTYEAEDASGNTTTKQATVTGPMSQS